MSFLMHSLRLAYHPGCSVTPVVEVGVQSCTHAAVVGVGGRIGDRSRTVSRGTGCGCCWSSRGTFTLRHSSTLVVTRICLLPAIACTRPEHRGPIADVQSHLSSCLLCRHVAPGDAGQTAHKEKTLEQTCAIREAARFTEIGEEVDIWTWREIRSKGLFQSLQHGRCSCRAGRWGLWAISAWRLGGFQLGTKDVGWQPRHVSFVSLVSMWPMSSPQHQCR